MLRVYGDVFSGNCYKVKLLLHQLGLEHEWRNIDILKRESRTPEFLALNSNGRIPVLQIAPDMHLAESNAILQYLANDGQSDRLWPGGRADQARALQWMFFEQYSHEPYVATARYIVRYLGRPPEQEERLQDKFGPGYAALSVMEKHLEANAFFAAGRYTVADIALYAYTHVAHEGGFDLARFPAVNAWMERVRGQPRHIGMG
ncbi:MAG: glutathione S-transferase family protein [Burkholderiales bacterium]|nr:glutathione S-transferase family protein [Burkholderiales bacterium]